MLINNTVSLAVALFTGVATAASVPAWEDWAHGRVQLKNVSMHFRYAGNGPPLLLVHGNPQHSVRFSISKTLFSIAGSLCLRSPGVS